MTTGTLVDYKRLSWAGTKARGNEVLVARTKVQSRPHGVIPGSIPPVKVASLLEEMQAKNEGKVDWLTWLRAEVAEYRAIRQGKKVEREHNLTLSIVKGY